MHQLGRTKTRMRPYTSAVLFLFPFACTFAAELHVPEDYPTIEAALLVAANYDTVDIGPGVYEPAFNLLYTTRPVSLIGRGGAAVTTLVARLFVDGPAGYSDTCHIEGLHFTLSSDRQLLLRNHNFAIRRNVFDLINVCCNATLYMETECKGIFENNLVRRHAYGLMFDGNSTMIARNNIFMECAFLAIIVADNHSSVFKYNCFSANGGDISGDSLDEGNLFEDPQINVVTFELLQSSPCIDAGDPSGHFDPDGSPAEIGPDYYEQPLRDFRIYQSDRLHVTDHNPRFAWHFYSSDGGQEAYELEVGSDADWSDAEMWHVGPVISDDTTVVYGGMPLFDATPYFARVRDSVNVWSKWVQLQFRMNGLPTVPTQNSPSSLGEVAGNPATVGAIVAFDPEADSQQLQFAIFMDDSLLVEESPLVPPTPVSEGDTVSWTGTVPLLENGSFIWAVRAFDGYEYTSYWDAWQVFFVNAIQEAPSVVTLHGPETDSIVYSQHPYFAWTPAGDPDPHDTVQYDYRISIDSLFAFALVVDSLADTTYADSVALETGRRYWWKVLSRDNHGLTAQSEVAQFRTYKPGDVDKSWSLTSADIITLVNYVFKGQPLAVPECGGRANSDSVINAADIIWLVNTVFRGGAEPKAGCG